MNTASSGIDRIETVPPAETTSLWKISSGKNGDKYLTFSSIANLNKQRYTATNDESDESSAMGEAKTIRVYKIRWYILLVICIANVSNSVNWIMYSSIADFTGQFYSVDYDAVNFLSLSYLIISTVAGFFSFWLIDNIGVRTSLNLGSWMNFLGSTIRVVSSIDWADGEPLVPQSSKYAVLMTGQSLCGLAQPFILFVTTKFANTWFADDQRALANTLALGSNALGSLVGSFVSSQIVDNQASVLTQMSLLNIIMCAFSLTPALMACFVTRSKPKCPPSYSAVINSNTNTNSNNNDRLLSSANYLINNEEADSSSKFMNEFRIYMGHVKNLLKSKDFLILLTTFGFALGLVNALTTLLEQILCVRGYTDEDVGYFGGSMIIFGLVGSVISGFILDKTKRFEEMAKICFSIGSVANIMLALVQLYNNDKSTVYYLTLTSFIIIGFFGLPLLPICMEMAVECVYPIPEATSTGLLMIAGQIFGIVMILAYPKLAKQVDFNSYDFRILQTCTDTSVPSNASFSSTTTTIKTTTSSELAVLDYTYPLYGQTAMLVLFSLIFVLFFKCAYLRLRSEREKLAEKILNSVRS
jgi:MFS transporter, FLVCR family, MFS-domain-containing protein 7